MVLRKFKAIARRSLRRGRYGSARSVMARYIVSNKTPALNIGCGRSHLPNWLNTDVEPKDLKTLYLDATRPFPAPSGSFAYIYTEHMIEHIPFAAGLSMLRECRRVLKPGGVLRVATPDLDFILSLYSNPGKDAESYIRWITDLVKRPDTVRPTAVSVINNAFRDWGHQFLYDAVTLESSLSEAGFLNIARVRYNESAHAELRGIERHGAAVGNVEMAMLETMIFEAS